MSTVDVPIRAYRETMELVQEVKGLYNADGAGKNPAQKGEPNGADSIKPSVGDFVQWESNGVLMFETPKAIQEIQEHEGQQWVFVEDSKTGIPMSEVTIEQKAAEVSTPPAIKSAPQRIQPTSSSEREWLRGSLSKEVNYRILVSGEVGPKEIGKLIKILTVQQDILSDVEDD